MRALTLYAIAACTALAAGCGGTGGSAASAAVAPTTQSCQTASPFAGAPLHAAVPASLFPAPDLVAASQTPLPEELSVLLDQKVRDILLQTGAPAVSAAITIPGLGRWRSTQGLAQAMPSQPVNAGTEFYWGSVAKALTAVVVLQLVEEGKFSLDDTLSRWYPQIPQAERITLAQLLNHSSGLQTNTNSLTGLGYETPGQQVAMLAQMPLLFCPGTNASYSNAGYMLLGLIVEAVEHKPFYQSVQQRIAEPLGLRHLRALLPDEDMPLALAAAHEGRMPKADPGAWTRLGAGNVVARSEDMVVFWQAVLTGRLLAPATVQAQWALLYMLDAPTPEPSQGMRWFGKGVMLWEWTDELGRQRTWLGHAGSIPTANAQLLYDPIVQAYAAVAVNNAVPSAAVANALLKIVSGWQTSR